MINIGNETKYLFIIDTDKYAGNFEREMCAFATGHVGDCDVGSEQREVFEQETEEQDVDEDILGDLEEFIIHEPDEHGCCRPVTITFSPDRKEVNGVGIFFSYRPRREVMEFIVERAKRYASEGHGRFESAKGMTVTGSRLLKIKTTVEEIAK